MPRLLSTSEFAKALGVSESSVRRLADAGELQIYRTRGGHRRIPVPEAVRYVRESKTRILRPDLLGLEVDPSEVSEGTAEQRMLSVLKSGHASAVISLMQSLYAGGMGIAALCDGPLAHSMGIIGAAWPHDKRSIFVEHRAVILASRALNQLRLSIPEPEADAPIAIGAAMSGDRYLLPTLMASLVMHDLGFNETNLGPDLPVDVLTDCVEDESPKLLWLAVSEPVRSRTQISEIMKLGETAKKTSTAFIIGGRHATDLQETLGDQPAFDWTYCSDMCCLEATARSVMSAE
ncbi:MAG: excisionase family DNA-binding protein [Planctomycetota bacterium]